MSKILTHNLEAEQQLILFKNIEHKNHYDFTKLHRHNYFELLFFEKGGGENLVDFIPYEVKNHSCYIIYPGQTHLLKRAPGSSGHLIQFRESVISSTQLEKRLQQKIWSGSADAIFFENEAEVFQKAAAFTQLLNKQEAVSNSNTKIKEHLLYALLYYLCGLEHSEEANASIDSAFYAFQQLVDLHFKKEQRVSFYINALGISEKRLATLSKKHMGISPLQLIHRRILLEAKRLLLLGEQAHKEIAYELSFDSPASFSAFVKKKTGMTASEVQGQFSKTHN